jgi:hypothetical protein
MFHVPDNVDSQGLSKSRIDKTSLEHHTNHPTGLGHYPTLLVIEVTPVLSAALNTGMRDDKRLTPVMH